MPHSPTNGKLASVQYLYKCTVSTMWHASTIDECQLYQLWERGLTRSVVPAACTILQTDTQISSLQRIWAERCCDMCLLATRRHSQQGVSIVWIDLPRGCARLVKPLSWKYALVPSGWLEGQCLTCFWANMTSCTTVSLASLLQGDFDALNPLQSRSYFM